MTALLRNRWFLIGIHALVIAGLIASLAGTVFHQRYMTRGVSFGENAGPIAHTDVNPLGVNTFLHEEVNPERIEQTLDMVAEAGFTFIRQIFVWSEIEPAPDTYWDDQNNVSTWDKYDRIMQMADERNLDVVARLDKPPLWAREGQSHLDEFPDGPPTDYQDYADFVAEVVSRYQDQINYVQLWNEPNLGVEWGGQEIDPAGFTELLAAGYEAVKQVDPDIAVIMPGLAPNDQTGPDNLSDLLFLEGMYEAGAQDYFDIAAVMVYGYGFSPWDRRVSFGRNNFSRPIQTREIMEEYGDENTPIWAVEYGWVSLPDDWEGHPSPWGQSVTQEEQAEYLYDGYRRAQEEWPWMGAMMIWGFRWASDPEHPDQVDNPTRGFRIVDHDFTPRPAYDLLYGKRGIFDRAYTGAYTADSRYLVHDDSWTVQEQRLSPDRPGAGLSIPFSGTGIELHFESGDGAAEISLGDETWDLDREDIAEGSFVVDGLEDGLHVLEMTVIEPGNNPVTITGFTVERRTLLSWIYPWLFVAISLILTLNLISLAGNMIRRPDERVQPMPESSTMRRLRRTGERVPER